ncbi:uncharacterized protein LOC111134583 [Crassostrea virginica]
MIVKNMFFQFNSGLLRMFLSCLIVLSAFVSGFQYLEPPDMPVELSRRAEVNATSCGLELNCTYVSCRSGNITKENFVKLLENITKECTGSNIPNESYIPSYVSKYNGYIQSTSSIRNNCSNVTMNIANTGKYFGFSFWIFISSTPTRDCNLFKIKGEGTEKQVKISGSPSNIYIDGNRFDPRAILKSNEWIHIFLRSENTSPSIFLDGVLYSGAPSLLMNPDAVILNIGCDVTILDFQLYNQYLTNREIQEGIYLGTDLSKMTISYPECRCPMDYPVLVRDSDDPSGVFCRNLTSNTKVTRLLSGTVDSLRDDNSNTFWNSSDDTPTVFFMFEQIFMIDNVTIEFVPSSRPGNVEIKLFARKEEKNTHNFSSISSNTITWMLRNDTPSENSSRSVVEKMVADTIEIKLSKKPQESVQIRAISIFGRCYCTGSSNSECIISGRTFNCTCDNNRNVLGVACEECPTGLYMDRDAFNCNQNCSCDQKGTKNENLNDCEDDGGQCTCKSNVQGRTCDTCKPLFYNFTESGCKKCDCGNGTKSCDAVSGRCICKNNVESNSSKCQNCVPFHYGVEGSECKACGCNPDGVSNSILSCSEPRGNCSCKPKVMGRTCNQCMDGYYNLDGDNSVGCSPCYCSKVGRMSEICDKGPQGLCTCRGNFTSSTNRACDPIFLSNELDPAFGPISGNTTITVKGQLLRSDNVTTEFSLDGSLYKNLDVQTDDMIRFQTPPYRIGKVTIKLRWSNAYERPDSKDFFKDFEFEYRLNPVVSSVQSIESFESGGCKISIKGNNLNSVSKPKLIVYENGTRIQKEQDCALVSSTEILCNSPGGFLKGTKLRYGVALDGTTEYVDYSKFETNKIEIVVDPVPTKEDGEVQEYKPVFKTEIIIEGQQFTSGCSSSDFTVVIKGSSANFSCTIKSLEKEMIKCEPDIDFPGVNDEEAVIMLFVGDRAYQIQKVKLHMFWNTWQFILIAVGGSVFILLVTLIPIFICCCCRSKRIKLNKTDDKAFSTLDQPDDMPLNPHQPRGRPNSYVGVQLETEHWDNFIHKINQSVRKLLNSSHVHKSEIVIGTRCIKKGSEIRIVNGNYATDTGKPNAGKSTIIKTLVNSYSSFDNELLPDWINSGLQECLRLRDIFDENVLQMQGVATDADRFFILYPGYKRSLKDYLLDKSKTPPTKSELFGMCVQLMEGVQHLHNMDIIHKDLAARNCVVDEDGNAKVTDAAFSWNLYPEDYMYDQRRGKYLPVRWMAPESLTAGFYDTASDVWSFGVLIWEIMSLSMYLPYHDQEENEKIKSYVVDTGYRLGKPENASDALYEDIMLRCWEHQGAHRPNFSDIGDKFEQLQNPNSDPGQVDYYNGPVANIDDIQNVYYNYGMN